MRESDWRRRRCIISAGRQSLGAVEASSRQLSAQATSQASKPHLTTWWRTCRASSTLLMGACDDIQYTAAWAAADSAWRGASEWESGREWESSVYCSLGRRFFCAVVVHRGSIFVPWLTPYTPPTTTTRGRRPSASTLHCACPLLTVNSSLVCRRTRRRSVCEWQCGIADRCFSCGLWRNEDGRVNK